MMKNLKHPARSCAAWITFCFVAGASFTTSSSAQGFAFLLEEGGTQIWQAERTQYQAWLLDPATHLTALLPGDLAWNESADRLLLLSHQSGQITEIQPWDSAAMPRANLGSGTWDGFVFDGTRQAYFALRHGRELWRIDGANFSASLHFDLGVGSRHGLTIDSAGQLWSLQDQPAALVQINPTANTMQLRASLTTPCTSIACQSNSTQLFVTKPNDLGFFALNPHTGTTTRFGTFQQLRAAPRSIVLPPCQGTLFRFGQGCNGGLGSALSLRPRGLPCLQHRLSVLLENDLFGPVYYVRGHSADHWGPLSLPFDLGLLGAPQCYVLNPHDIVVGPVQSGSYYSQFVPPRIELVGGVLHWQGYSLAVGVPNVLSLATSDAVRFAIGR